MTHHRCPECGEHAFLYRRADVTWSQVIGAWIETDVEDLTDCTNCDWTGSVEETVVHA